MDPDTWECKPPWRGMDFNKNKLVLKRHRSSQEKSKDRERNTKVLQKWISDDEVFVEISAFQTIVKKVSENQICVIIGSSNCGKTATMRHIALLLQIDFEVISVSDPMDVINFGYHDDIQLFTLDDYFNQLTVERKNMDRLEYLEKSIMYALGEKSKLIMTCDKETYNLMKINGFAFHLEYIVDLDNEEFRINMDERECILARYLKDRKKARAISENLSLIQNIENYPVLCNLFSRIDQVQEFHSFFFTHWRECIWYVLDKMKTDCSLQYAVLVLCVLCKNSLTQEKLEQVVNEKYQVFLDCKVKHKVHHREAKKALSELLGKFVLINDKDSYVVIHTALANEIAFHYGRDFPTMILENMSYGFIQRWLQEKLHNTNHDQTLDSIITIEDSDDCTVVCHRLFSSIEEGDLHSVFKSKLLCNKAICENFLQLIQKKSLEQIKNIFLLPKSSLLKVVPGVIQESESRHHSTNPFQKIFLTTSHDITEDMLLADQTKEYDSWTQKVRVICWVIYYGHAELLKYILKVTKENGMDTREVLFMGTTTTEAEKEASRMLVLACYGGNEEIVKLLISNFNSEDMNRHSKRLCTSDVYHADTPLTAACRRGHFSVVKLLVAAGASINQVNAFNETPLCAALESRNIVLIKFLLERKASESWSALLQRKESTDTALLDLLRDGKPDLENLMQMASKAGNVATVKYLLGDMTGSDQHYQYKTSSLLIAIKNGHRKVVQLLIQAGAGSKCTSALYAAIDAGNHGIALDIIRRYEVCRSVQTDLTLLVRAAKSGNIPIFKEFFVNCTKTKCMYLAKKISLFEVISNGHVEIALMLIKYGANVNENSSKITPLYIASEKGYTSIVLALIRSGAKPNLRLKTHKTFPLYIASKNGHINVVKLLIKAGANLKMKTEESFTSLMISVLENKPKVTKCLVDAENLKEKLGGNCHLFEILKSFKRAEFHLNEFDNIVPKGKNGFLVKREGDLMENIIRKDVRHLSHLIDLGLDPNDDLAIYEKSSKRTSNESLLSVFIYKWLESTQRVKKIQLLVERGAKFNVKDLRYSPGCQCDSSFPDVMNEIRWHVRRNSL